MNIVSENIYDRLGNTVEDDEIPRPPVQPVDKTSTRTVKRNTDGMAPSKGPVTTGNRRGGANVSGNEAAFRDRNAGRDFNRGKSTDEASRGARRGGYRGGRGGRREEGDRHPTKSAPHSNSEKQAAQSWGANEGQAELKDEQAAAEIAESEQKAEGEASAEGGAKEEEPEDTGVAFSQWEKVVAQKENEVKANFEGRPANEGVSPDKWKEYAPLPSKNNNEVLYAGAGGKTKRERERKTKQFVELENRYIEPERTRGGRGGRGGARGEGGRGRGDSGRGRGDSSRGRGSGAPRGEFRGAPRGEFRGGRGGRGQDSQPLNPSDESAFPSLGGKN